MGHFKKTLKGLFWMGGLQGTIRLITFVRLGILARLLTPFEFGLFGVATLILALLETITDTGVNVFFIQREGKLEEYINTAWIVSIARGVIISLILLLGAPLIALFFKSPSAIYLIRLIALASFIRGFLNPAIVQFQKKLQFNKEFILRVTCAVADICVSIVITLITKSAVALVWGMIASVSVELAISHLLITPRPSFHLEKSRFIKVVDRGKWVTLAGIFQYLFSNGDNIIVGRLMGTSFLGLYQMAYRISTIPITEISDVASRVNFAVYSEVANEKVKLKDIFIKSFMLVFAVVVPIGLVIFLFTNQVITFILGVRWLMIAPALKVLSVFGVVRALEGTTPPLFLAFKKQEYVTALTLASMLGLGVTIVPLVLRYGIIGAAYSAMCGTILCLPVIFYCLYKVFK